MKRILIVLTTAALLLTPAIAGDMKSTVRGCLMQMGEDFILTDAAGTKIEIDGMNDALKANLGKTVEITGEWEGRSDDDKHEAQKLDAKNVVAVAGTCPAAAQAAPSQAAAPAVGATTGAATTGTARVESDAPVSAAGSVTTQTTTPSTTTITTTAPATGTVQAGSGTTTATTTPGATVSGSTTTTAGTSTTGTTMSGTATTTQPATGSTVSGAATVGETGVAASVPGQPGVQTDFGKNSIEGCVSRSGKNYILVTADGKTYRLDGEGDKLASQVGKRVALKGEQEAINETDSSGAKFEFDVEEVTSLEGACPASSIR